MQKRITVFTGAGSVVDIGGPTGYQVTENIKKINIGSSNDFESFFVKKVADELETYYNQQPVNFEEIFHAIERLNSYMYAWRQKGIFERETTKETARLYKPVLGAFLPPPKETNIFFTNKFIGVTLGAIISAVSNLIRQYDKTFEAKNVKYQWYSDFWKYLNKNTLLDLGTLNYDTVIERIIEVNDGFNLNGRFNPAALINREKNRMFHLHGCINYAPQIDSPQYQELVKCKDYTTAENLRSRYIKQYSINQNGEFSIMGRIISGLNKTEKIQTIPYIFYNSEFIQNIINNNSLLIIGYSFGDNYLNEIIANFINIHKKNKKLVIITKMPENIRNNPHGSLNGEYGNFIRFINTYTGMPTTKKYLEIEATNDGSVLVYFNGLKDASTNHTENIINFLNS